jgi:FixJ family two-component response regulator
MPGMSGLDLQSKLIALRQDIPIVFITAFAEERRRKQAEAAGAVGFFSKPVDSRMIIGCLDAVLKRG